MQPHVMARPVLDRGGAADRMRNHLRRRAITRLGLIEGDLYLLPYWRAAGQGPQAESGFYLLGSEVGDPRLLRLDLPPADLAPFDAAAVPAGARLVEASLDAEAIAGRAGAIGWKVASLDQLIHYPFWLMRLEDSGRFEAGWIDGVEGRLILHTLKVPEPVMPLKHAALLLAAPAAVMGIAALATGSYAAIAAIAGAASVATGAWLAASMANAERRERAG